MFGRTLLVAALAAASLNAHASLTAGDIAFTSFNADEDGLSFVAFKDIDANTSIYFSDNEWNGSAFNTGESYNVWSSGASAIGAGSVVRLSAYDKTSLSASLGTLSRVSVSGSSNWGIANSGETVYAYLGSAATAPTTFLAAITNGDFASDGSLANTGLVEGSSAIRLNTNQPSATPDFGEYIGLRVGLTNFDAYKALVADVNNWTIDTTNGNYALNSPDITAFSIETAPVPVPGAVWLFGSALFGYLGVSRRKA